MDGPITREDLRNIGPRVIQAELDKLVDLIVQDIKKGIIDKAFNTLSGHAPIDLNSMAYGRPTLSSNYQIKYDTNRLSGYHRLVNMNMLHKHIKRSDTINNVVSRMRCVFPDMKIIVDPLETYILFDWSA
jgi:hypothetical protein